MTSKSLSWEPLNDAGGGSAEFLGHHITGVDLGVLDLGDVRPTHRSTRGKIDHSHVDACLVDDVALAHVDDRSITEVLHPERNQIARVGSEGSSDLFRAGPGLGVGETFESGNARDLDEFDTCFSKPTLDVLLGFNRKQLLTNREHHRGGGLGHHDLRGRRRGRG